ncbi:Cationic peroxidase 1 [Platanthera guangdongensis]|uniref:Cationic peroxidase 1 n=1 Tax=Platanthera guangdongensis TaxID=2320717 RepID=A0ABR2M660_9ASPA
MAEPRPVPSPPLPLFFSPSTIVDVATPNLRSLVVFVIGVNTVNSLFSSSSTVRVAGSSVVGFVEEESGELGVLFTPTSENARRKPISQFTVSLINGNISTFMPPGFVNRRINDVPGLEFDCICRGDDGEEEDEDMHIDGSPEEVDEVALARIAAKALNQGQVGIASSNVHTISNDIDELNMDDYDDEDDEDTTIRPTDFGIVCARNEDEELHPLEFPQELQGIRIPGCDGSVLLDDTSSFTGEKTAAPNQNSLRGFDVVDNIKKQVEAVCNQTVSCADILAVAARDSVVALGGPTWTVKLGRRDSTAASLSQANSDIPSPTSDLSALMTAFSNKGLSTSDMITLSGAHTIGQARCAVFRTRIYNETNIDSAYAASLKSNCPSTGGDNNLSPLDVQTPTTFDNDYYNNLVNKKGLLHSDQQLFNGGSTDSQVNTYNSNPSKFLSDFAVAIVKMGDISPLTGTQGQVRLNCRKIN